MEPDAVQEAVNHLDSLVRADGAALRLVEANPKTARVEIALDLSGVECLDCVLPPELLEQMVTAAVQERVRGEFELLLRDPRRD